jgi:Domain of unknown function (DUF6457)
MDSEPGASNVSLGTWMDRIRASLGPDDPTTALSAEEERLILELARVAAHSSERIAAPLTTFVAGLALAGLPPDARAGRLRELLDDIGD